MSSALVSIITPVYNAESTIIDTINSVLSQSYSNWELIIVDDCSKDGSLDVIKGLPDEHSTNIKVISLLENKGVANARNIGLENAIGEYVAFLDSDDIWDVEKLQKQVSFMQDLACDISFTAYRKFNENGIASTIISVPESVDYKNLLFGNVIPCSSSMFRREKLLSLRFVRIGHEDFVFWLTALKTISLAYGLNEVLMFYRISSTSISANKIKAATYTWNIFRKVEKLSLLKSTFYFISYALQGFRKYMK